MAPAASGDDGGCGCPADEAVDWEHLLSELRGSLRQPPPPLRRMALCVVASAISALLPRPGSCWLGGLSASLQAFRCDRKRWRRDLPELASWLPGDSAAAWREVAASPWPVFELLARLGREVPDDEPRAAQREALAASERGWGAPDELRAAMRDALATPAPELDAAGELHAAMREALSMSRVPFLEVLLSSAELAGRLAQLHAATSPGHEASPEPPAAFDRALGWTVPGASLAMAQSSDPSYPWVRPIAHAMRPRQLHVELPWPTGVAFEVLRSEALGLLRAAGGWGFESPANFRGTWQMLCIVCRNGSTDPQLASEDDAGDFVWSPLAASRPTLRRFVALFGRTLRVRLSVVKAGGGMIGWHADANVLEAGRLIVHVPLVAPPLAMNRVGQVLFQMPEGRIHWADYALPHTVFNADPADRVHLLVEVLASGNTDFERNFLRGLDEEARHVLREAAIPQGPPGEWGPIGTRFARSVGRLMTQGFSKLYGPAGLVGERAVWRELLGG